MVNTNDSREEKGRALWIYEEEIDEMFFCLKLTNLGNKGQIPLCTPSHPISFGSSHISAICWSVLDRNCAGISFWEDGKKWSNHFLLAQKSWNTCSNHELLAGHVLFWKSPSTCPLKQIYNEKYQTTREKFSLLKYSFMNKPNETYIVAALELLEKESFGKIFSCMSGKTLLKAMWNISQFVPVRILELVHTGSCRHEKGTPFSVFLQSCWNLGSHIMWPS